MLTSRRRAAAEKLPSSAAATKYCSARSLSMAPPGLHIVLKPQVKANFAIAASSPVSKRALTCCTEVDMQAPYRVIALVVCVAAAMSAGTPAAQDFPSKPVRMIVPSPAGSPPALRARELGDRLATLFGR